MSRVWRRGGLLFVALALVVSGCGTDGDTTGGETDAKDGPTITVGSFNFPESIILAEIYAQALEAEGYPVETKLDLGSREVIFPSLESGEIDFLPEYLGSSLSVGFSQEPPTGTDEAVEALREAFAEDEVEVLEPAPGEDKNVFVVTEAFAEEHGLESISDLADAGEVTLGAPPECEERDTCLLGLRETYGLDNVVFEVIPETSGRVSALEEGTIDVALMFSTQPVIAQKGWVALEDDETIVPAENIVPVVRGEIVEGYGEDFTSFVNSITEDITTELLLELNGQVENEAQDPEDVAQAWLEEEGFLD